MEDFEFVKQGQVDQGYDPSSNTYDFMITRLEFNEQGILEGTAIAIAGHGEYIFRYNSDPDAFFAQITNTISHESLHGVMGRLAGNWKDFENFYEAASRALDNKNLFGDTTEFVHPSGFNEVGLIQCMRKHEKKKMRRT